MHQHRFAKKKGRRANATKHEAGGVYMEERERERERLNAGSEENRWNTG